MVAKKEVKAKKEKRAKKEYDATLNLSPNEGSTKRRKRLGAGRGSGLGKTSGRGQKGQKSRSGGGVKPGFEGGQMPLQRRVPKRGFNNIHQTVYFPLNLAVVNKLNDLNEVNKEVLLQRGIMNKKAMPVKLLANGDLDRAVTFYVDRASKSAIEKVEKAGGKVILPEEKPRREKFKKSEKRQTPRVAKKKLNKIQEASA